MPKRFHPDAKHLKCLQDQAVRCAKASSLKNECEIGSILCYLATMDRERYFIKPDYKINEVISFDQESPKADEYWQVPDHLEGSRSYQWPVYKRLSDYIAKTNAKSVADIGCGSGLKLMRVAQMHAGVEFAGFDQASAIRFCTKTHRQGKWNIANLDQKIIWDGPRFDIVNCSDVIEHLRSPEVILESLRTLVRPGGLILLSTPERDKTRGKGTTTCPNPYHVREWNQSEFEQFVRSEGFTIESTEMLFPVRLGSPFKLLIDPVLRAVTFRSINYNMLCTLRTKSP
jgi:SAM-dependent methyltransferase